MDVAALLIESFGRVPDLVAEATDGLDVDQLTWAPHPGANTVGWLIWHLTRVQDHHLAELLDEPQVWVDGPWSARFGLAPDPDNTGYGHTADEVAAVRPDGVDALVGYHAAVHERTVAFLVGLSDDDLDRVVDRRWDPPVTLGVRLVSVLADALEHVGQAAYLRGLLRS